MMQGYERSKVKVGERPAIEEEREIYLPDEYRMGAPDRMPMMVRAFDPDREGSMMGYMTYKKGGLHKAASQVRSAGRHDDTMLIHVNEEEFQKMREMFGDPIMNPETGLPEYGFFKSLKKAFKKIAPVLSVASLFVPGLNIVGGLARGISGVTGLGAGVANTLAGATVGGLTGGKKGAVMGGLGGFASSPGAAQSLGSKIPGLTNPTLQTAAGRGLAGAAGAALTGGDPLSGGLMAAGAGYGADQLAGSQFVQQGLRNSPLLQQAALGAAQGLNVAGQTGGDLGKGALIGGALGAATSAADSALARFKNEPQAQTTMGAGYKPPEFPGMQAPAQPVAQQVQAGVQANLAPVMSNLLSRPEASMVISQASQVATKAEAVQAAAALGANPDTRPVYDAMSNFKMCDNAPHFGACFSQNFGTFMNSISQNSPKLGAPMAAKTGGLARYAQGGYASGGYASGGYAFGGYASGGMPGVASSMVELAVGGPGDGQDDQIPALLSDGEFIIPADVVSALGSGSTDAGSKALYDMIHNVRGSYRKAGVKDIPQKAKSPLQYMKARAK
jgi:hypothetical protein